MSTTNISLGAEEEKRAKTLGGSSYLASTAVADKDELECRHVARSLSHGGEIVDV
jgi:hypothetical protein